MASQNYNVYLDEVKKINGEIKKMFRPLNPWDFERLHRLELKRQWYGNLMRLEEKKKNKDKK